MIYKAGDVLEHKDTKKKIEILSKDRITGGYTSVSLPIGPTHKKIAVLDEGYVHKYYTLTIKNDLPVSNVDVIKPKVTNKNSEKCELEQNECIKEWLKKMSPYF